jgi:hypothetical protein
MHDNCAPALQGHKYIIWKSAYGDLIHHEASVAISTNTGFMQRSFRDLIQEFLGKLEVFAPALGRIWICCHGTFIGLPAQRADGSADFGLLFISHQERTFSNLGSYNGLRETFAGNRFPAISSS